MMLLTVYVRSLLQALAGVLMYYGVKEADASAFVSATVPIVVSLLVHVGSVLWSVLEKSKLLDKIAMLARF